MSDVTLIYCAGGNATFAEIAISAGFRYGACLPQSKPYASVFFSDQNWKHPKRAAYMAALAVHRPHMATVVDWERTDQFDEVMDWAEEAAQYAAQVVIIPKVINELHRIPARIGTAEVVIGLSVPTRHGGTEVPIWEFAGRRIHLLGGSPQAQMHYYQHLSTIAEVVSVDGNMAAKLAHARCHFWTNGTARYAKDRYWPQLNEVGWSGQNANAEAFRRSCRAIAVAWRSL